MINFYDSAFKIWTNLSHCPIGTTQNANCVILRILTTRFLSHFCPTWVISYLFGTVSPDKSDGSRANMLRDHSLTFYLYCDNLL